MPTILGRAMITYSLSASGAAPPIYKRLCDALRADIRARRISPDAKLPSKRAFAAQLGVSVVTVETAYAQLLSEGWIYSRPRSGYFATPLAALPEPPPPPPRPAARRAPHAPWRAGATATHGDDPAARDEATFPFSVWAKIVRRLLSGSHSALLAPTPPAGAAVLREAIAAHLREFRGMDVDPELVFVAAGAETLYGILVRAFGTARPWAVENPGHRTIAAVYRQCGADVRPVRVDSRGLDPAALEKSGAAFAHVSPAHQYPTGVVAPAARRCEWLAWAAAQKGRVLVEDDYDSELRAEGLPLPTLFSMDGSGRVVHLGTFSRTLAPSLRVGWMAVPEALAPRFREIFAPLSCTVSGLTQYTLAAFLSEGHFARHLSRTRTRCRRVRAGLLAAIGAAERRSGDGGRGGLPRAPRISEERAGPHFLVSLGRRRPDRDLVARASALGLRLRLLSSFYDGEAPAESFSRLVVDYSSLPLSRVAEAASLLSRLAQGGSRR